MQTDADDFGYLSFTNYQSGITNDRVAEIRALKNGTNVDTGEFAFYTSNGSGPTERMRLASDGNVGIGTSSPNRELHVIGQFAIDRTGGGLLVSPDSTSNKVYSRTGNANNTPHPLDFISGGSTSMRIDSTGNVGIGTTSPGAKLEVKNGSSGQAYSNVEGILIDTNGNSNSDYSLRIGSSAGNDNLVVTNAGRVGIGTDQPEVSLDLGNNTDAIQLPAGDNTARAAISNPFGWYD